MATLDPTKETAPGAPAAPAGNRNANAAAAATLAGAPPDAGQRGGAAGGAGPAGQQPGQAGQRPGEAGQDPASGAQDRTKQALQGRQAGQSASAGAQTVSPGAPGTNAAKVGEAAQPQPPVHPRKADIDADRQSMKNVSSLEEYRSMVSFMRVVASPASKASVDLRIKKLSAALTRAKVHLRAAYGEQAEPKIKEFYDDRLVRIEAELAGLYKPKAEAAAGKIEQSGTVNDKDLWDATGALSNYKHMGPEELVAPELLDTTRGVMKVYDVGSLYEKSMDAPFQQVWTQKGGGKEGFIAACKAKGSLALLPDAAAADPLYVGTDVAQVFPKMANGFVGLGKDAGAANSFQEAITRFALKDSYYPSGVMFSSFATATDVKAELPNMKMGKPSIFYLLNFDENTYDEKDRVFGHLADPADPSKPGSALELQCIDMPQAILLKNGRILQ